MSAISALTRGENLEAKRIFIRIQGLELLSFLTMNEPSPRLLHKVNNLWRDLLFYDPYLHLTHKDLSSFSNTTNLKVNPGDKKHDISFDPNEEAKEKNELP